MFSLKIDVDNKGGRVWTTGKPNEIYGAIGTVTVEVLKDVIPKIQQNLSPKRSMRMPKSQPRRKSWR